MCFDIDNTLQFQALLGPPGEDTIGRCEIVRPIPRGCKADSDSVRRGRRSLVLPQRWKRTLRTYANIWDPTKAPKTQNITSAIVGECTHAVERRKSPSASADTNMCIVGSRQAKQKKKYVPYRSFASLCGGTHQH